MFPRSQRVPSPIISFLMRKGARTRLASLDSISDFSPTEARFAVIVPSRIDKRATVRNRIKRLVREAISHIHRDTPLHGTTIVVVRGKLPDSVSAIEAILRKGWAIA